MRTGRTSGARAVSGPQAHVPPLPRASGTAGGAGPAASILAQAHPHSQHYHQHSHTPHALSSGGELGGGGGGGHAGPTSGPPTSVSRLMAPWRKPLRLPAAAALGSGDGGILSNDRNLAGEHAQHDGDSDSSSSSDSGSDSGSDSEDEGGVFQARRGGGGGVGAVMRFRSHPLIQVRPRRRLGGCGGGRVL